VATTKQTLGGLLTYAIARYARDSNSSDAVSFHLERDGSVTCIISGVGGKGRSPEAALRAALAEWQEIHIDARAPLRTSNRRAARRRVSRRGASRRVSRRR